MSQKMNEVVQYIFAEAKKHGVGFLILLAVVWYFHEQNEKIQAKVDACNGAMLEVYRQQNGILINAVDRNSTAMENLSSYLKDLKTKP